MIIKIFNTDNTDAVALRSPQNVYTDYESGGNVKLCFDISPMDSQYKMISEEINLEYNNIFFNVKKINERKTVSSIEAVINLDDLKKNAYFEYKLTEKTLTQSLSEVLSGTGWQFTGAGYTKKKHTIELEDCNTLSILDEIRSIWNCQFIYDNKNKVITVVNISSITPSGAYFTDELNLKKLEFKGDSTDFATRLICRGKKDENGEYLTFASINGGKDYIENFTYCDKIITKTWIDERYTDKASLKADAEKKLAEMAIPYRSYNCTVADISDAKVQYNFLKVNLYDIVTLIDRRRGTRINHSVCSIRRYDNSSSDNVITLNSNTKTIQGNIEKISSSLKNVSNTVNNHQQNLTQLKTWADTALTLTKDNIINSDNQSVIISNNGYLGRQSILDESGNVISFSPEQIRLTNNILAFTEDNWSTLKTAIGKIAVDTDFWGEPIYKYGICADAIVGKMILGENLSLYGGTEDNGVYSITLNENGLRIINDGTSAGISIEDKWGNKQFYVDSTGNLALDGYLTRQGSPITMSVGYDQDYYHGIFGYYKDDYYKRSDGTYAPFLEMWAASGTPKTTMLVGVTKMGFAVKDTDPDSHSVYSRLHITPNGGEMIGAWSFSQEQKFTVNIGANCFKVNNGDTTIGTLYKSTTDNLCLFSNNNKEMYIGVNGFTSIAAKSGGGQLNGNWEIVDANSYYRLTTNTSGGKLYGAWDFNQEQKFSHTINAPAFIARSGNTKVMSLYISTTNNPCFNSDNSKDYIFSVGGTGRFRVQSTGAYVYGSFSVGTESGYSSIVTDQTGNGGGKLWGSWYLGNSTAVTSDETKKNSIETLDNKYSVLFDNLRPVKYKYNDGTSNRFHTGFIAQDVKTALDVAELDTSEFAGYVKETTEDGDENYYLRYEEFISLAVKEIQTLKNKVAELEAKINN